MDLDSPYGDDAAKFRSWLFARLRDELGPAYTWDDSVSPIHTSFEDWHVFGTYQDLISNPQTPGRVSPATKSVPSPTPSALASATSSAHHSRHGSRQRSHDQTKAQKTKVVARVSKYILRLERQFELTRTNLAEADPKGIHHLQPINILRLHPKHSGDSPLAVLILKYAGHNDLSSLVDCGPTWYEMADAPTGEGPPSFTSPTSTNLNRPEVRTFLDFAIEAAECCEVIHQAAGIVHGELRPDSFHWNRHTGTVKLINLGSGVRSFEDRLTSTGWAMLSREYGVEHKLQFYAPEQTGRLGTQPNARSDLYRLGVIYWTMLTGEMPFSGESPLEIMQAVLNQRIPPVTTKRVDVPDALSAVISKLLTKNIDARYYSASGLKWDLQEIKRLLAEGDSDGLANFQMAQKDVHSFFTIPEMVIGRADEQEQIRKILSRTFARSQASYTKIRPKRALSPLSSNDSVSEKHTESTSQVSGQRRNSRRESVSTDSSKNSTPVNVALSLDSRVRDDNLAVGSPKSEVLDCASFPKKALDKRLSTDHGTTSSLSSDYEMRSLAMSGASADNSSLWRTASTKFRRRHGKTEVVAISGPPGIGKSTLVQSIQASARQQGYFAAAKFDQLSKTPYGPLLEVLSSIFRQVFSESDVNTDFHLALRTFIKPAFHLLATMLNLPTWLLDGAASTKTSMARAESVSKRKSSHGQVQDSSNMTCGGVGHTLDDLLRSRGSSKSVRFSAIFLDVLRYLSSQKLICFALDDAHFADEESADLILSIISAQIPIVIFITRRTRVPIPSKLNSILNSGSSSAHLTDIELAPLTEAQVGEFVQVILHREHSYIFSLVAVLTETSGGNPFYLREALDLCYTKKCLWYSWEESRWTFDLDRTFATFGSQSHGLRFNSEFILSRLLALPPMCRQLIAWASLIGSSFSFPLIKRLMMPRTDAAQGDVSPDYFDPHPHQRGGLVRQASQDVLRALQMAIASFIIMPGEDDDHFAWCHDRYQQAAAALPECKDLPGMHFAVANAMLQGDDENFSPYTLSSHICIAVDVIRRKVRNRAVFRDTLFHAAEQAMQSGGYRVALSYLANALALLQPDCWDDDQEDVNYQETLLLYHQTAGCYYAQGSVKSVSEAIRLLEKILANARTPIDKAPAWILQSRICTRSGDYKTAFKTLKECLSHLGIDLPNTTWEQCDEQFHRLKTELEMIDKDLLLARPLGEYHREPTTKAPELLSGAITTSTSSHARVPSAQDRGESSFLSAVGAVLCEAIGCAFWSDALLFYQLALLEVDINLHRGVVPQTALGYIHLATIAISRFNQVEFGHEMGQLAIAFLDRNNTDSYTRGRGITLHGMLLSYFSVPVRSTLSIHEQSLEHSLTTGDRWAALLNVGVTVAAKLYSSDDLADIESFCNYGAEELQGWHEDVRGAVFIVSVRQFCRALQGKTFFTNPDQILDDRNFNASTYIDFLENKSMTGAQKSCALFLFYKLWAHFMYGQHRAVIETSKLIAPMLPSFWTSRPVVAMPVFVAMSQIALLRDDPEALDAEEVKSYAREHVNKMKQWSSVENASFASWTFTLEAELYDLEGEYGECLACLEKALDHAEVHSMWMEYALTLEVYGDFMVRRGSKRAARSTILDAISSYRQISAVGKAQQLTQKHEWLLQGTSSLLTTDTGVQTEATYEKPMVNTIQEKPPVAAKTQEKAVEGQGLDILDLTSILRSTQVLSSELQMDKLFPKLTEIILESTGGEHSALIIEDEDAGYTLDQVEDAVGKQITLYSLRFKELVFCNNIYDDVRFSNVPESYRLGNPLGKAMIAMPIIRGDSLLGCLYVEGEAHSFAERSVTVLRLLVNSISTSIANAQLFRQYERVSASNKVMIDAQKHALAQARQAEKKAKEAEAEARRNVKLAEEAAKTKSMFLANVSHELRTPLNGVIGMSELLKGTPLSAEQNDFTESIRVCADTLLTVINDILDYSKLEAGKMQLFSVPLSLVDSVEEVVRALSFSNTGKHLETVVDLDHIRRDMMVVGDPVRLHQVLMNLLSNAYKFTNVGRVTIRGRVNDETDEHVQVTFCVQDTGIGISEAQKLKLFQPFSQADSSTARRYGGTGLGLSIVRAIIENVLKGKIWLESELGKGTAVSFSLKFPKAPAGQADAQDSRQRHNTADPMAIYSPQPRSEDGSGSSPAPPKIGNEPLVPEPESLGILAKIPRSELRICIAEDNPVNQKIAVQYVKKLGMTCSAFNDGRLAVDALIAAAAAGEPYHIVLMDVQMPNLDGMNATREIRKHANHDVSSVLIIAMTASAIRGDREKCLAAGMNNYLAKPVRQMVLREMLEGYLSGREEAIPSLQRDDSDAALAETASKASKASKANGDESVK